MLRLYRAASFVCFALTPCHISRGSPPPPPHIYALEILMQCTCCVTGGHCPNKQQNQLEIYI